MQPTSRSTTIGTIAAGKMFGPACQRRSWLQALGLAVLFGAGTFICVTGSASRSAEVGQHKAAEARTINEARARVEGDLSKAQAERAELSRQMARECATGKGKRCDGLRATIEFADTHIAMLDGALARLQPEQTENGGLHHAAKVFALVLRAKAKNVEAGLVLLWPFAKALMLEIATIVFFSIGLHGKPATERRSVAERLPATQSISGPPEPPNGRGKSKRLPANVISLRKSKHSVVAAIEGAGRSLSNRELAATMGVSEGEASKRWQEVAHLLDVGRAGKELRLSLRSTSYPSPRTKRPSNSRA